MAVSNHNKLVRDNTPEIIKNEGGTPHIRILDSIEYGEELIRKLHEEAEEFRASRSLEELADVMEVVCSLANLYGYSMESIDAVRIDKEKRNGGFKKQIYLTYVDRE